MKKKRNKLSLHMRLKGITQREMAARAGITLRAVNKICTNKTNPSEKNEKILFKILELTKEQRDDFYYLS